MPLTCEVIILWFQILISEINYLHFKLVPPPPPKLTVYLEEIDSLQLKWTDTAEPDTPILGTYNYIK